MNMPTEVLHFYFGSIFLSRFFNLMILKNYSTDPYETSRDYLAGY